MEIYTFTPDEEQKNLRIDKFLSEQLPDQSRSYLQKLLKEGNVTVNEKTVKANYKVQLSDTVKLELPEPECPDILPEDIPLDILYEDEDLLFVDKPTGIVSHPSKGHTCDSLINGVQAYFEEKGSFNNKRSNIHLIGRLDKETSGILGIAKNSVTAERLIRQRKTGVLVKELSLIHI